MSPNTTAIAHLPATPYTILRLDYLIACQGDYCAAKMLSLFEAWSESKQDAVEQAQYHNKAAAKEGSEPTHDETTWLYNTLDHIRERLLGEYSIKTINKALKALEEHGFLKSRFNPRHKWDRTKQYQFQTEVVQAAVYRITPEQLQQYISPKAETLDFLHLVNLPNGSGRFTKSIGKYYQMDLVDLPNRSGNITKSSITKSLIKESNKETTQTNKPTQPTLCVREENKNGEGREKSNQEKGQGTTAVRSSSVGSKGQDSRSAAAPKAKGRSRSARARTEFEQWKQQCEPQAWEAFLDWKAEQAPGNVRDRRAWAYNTFKADLERTRLSWQSFQQERTRTPAPSEATAPPDFAGWAEERHAELAREYLSKSVAFLRQESWHRDWVEFVNATYPDLFVAVQREVQR